MTTAPSAVSSESSAPPAPPPVTPSTGRQMPPEPPRKGSGGTTAALILIGIGMVALGFTLMPWVDWWRFWPLIFVAVGIGTAITPGKRGWGIDRVLDGLVSVTFGAVFLLMTLGLMRWTAWWDILRLWPVLLIAGGLGVLGETHDSRWLRALGSIVIIAALALGVWTATQGGTLWDAPYRRGAVVSTDLSWDEDSFDSARLDLSAGAVELSIGPGSGKLISVVGESVFGTPELDVTESAGSADVRLDINGPSTGSTWDRTAEPRYDVALSSAPVWDMSIDTGAALVDAELADIPVRSLSLSPGVAECRVTLGDVPQGEERGTVSVDAGLSSILIRLPRDSEVRLASDSGLSDVNVPREMTRTPDGHWETEGYQRAVDAGSPVWEIDVDSGLTSLTLEMY